MINREDGRKQISPAAPRGEVSFVASLSDIAALPGTFFSRDWELHDAAIKIKICEYFCLNVKPDPLRRDGSAS